MADPRIGGIATHQCPAPECDDAVPNARFACSRDWFRLPKDLRDELWRTAKLSITNDRRGNAVVAAIEWYRAHPRAPKAPS